MAKAKKVEKTKIEELFDDVKVNAEKAVNAGFGAYGRIVEELETRFEKLTKDSEKLYNDLAKEGKKVQADLEKQVEEAQDKVEEQIEKVKAKAPKAPFANLSDKIEELTAKLDKAA